MFTDYYIIAQIQIMKSCLLLPITTLLCVWPCLQASLKTLSQSCLCDTTTNCDLQCCCDTDCASDIQGQLFRYDRCGDDGFGIPLCSSINKTDLHVDDLYSGLRTIYTVMKRLFCVQRTNIIDSTTFYNKSSTEAVITSAITASNNIIDASTLQSANISSLPTAPVNGLFYGSEAGVCVVTGTIPSNIGTGGMRECRALLDSANVNSSSVLSIATIRTNFPSIRVYNMKQSTTISPTIDTSISTSCSLPNCSKVVRFLKLFIHPDTNQVRQDLSYVVIGDLANVASGSYIIVKYEYTYLNSDGSFANVSNIGYKIGSPLQLLKSSPSGTTTNYFKANNPINLSYRKPTGQCRITLTDESDQSVIQLKLGRNEFHTCIGSTSYIYGNLKNSFNLIGIMGSSNRVLSDYIEVPWVSLNASPDPSNVLLKIYYVKVGSSFNPQYYIAKATVEIITNGQQDKTLFIQYQEVSSATQMYIPPPPKVDAYLPNDFLFPFYVAQ